MNNIDDLRVSATSENIRLLTRGLVARIQDWAAQFPRAKSQIADAAGLAPNTLARFESAEWSPTLHTLRRLEALVQSDWKPMPSTSLKSH